MTSSNENELTKFPRNHFILSAIISLPQHLSKLTAIIHIVNEVCSHISDIMIGSNNINISQRFSTWRLGNELVTSFGICQVSDHDLTLIIFFF